jgi:aromatic ring-opening dioxygenase LigB subunit
MPLIYACIAPHAGDLIDDLTKVDLTRQTMLAMGERLRTLAPEVIVIINPHGFRVQEALSISVADRATADWSPDVKLDFEMDSDLAHDIADEATTSNVPVVRYIYGASGGDSCYIPLDWGAVVLFMGHRFPKPKIVHCSRCVITHSHTLQFGRAWTCIASDKRIAFIASADQGHAHAQWTVWIDPASKVHAWMQVIRNGFDECQSEWVEDSKPDGLWRQFCGHLKDPCRRN